MKNGCGIIRISDARSGGKIKSRASVKSRLQHNLRGDKLSDDPRLWHINKSENIKVLKGSSHVDEMFSTIEKIYDRLGVQPTEGVSKMRDSVHAVELLLAYSPDMKNKINQKQWEKDCVDFLNKKFGKRVVSIVVHYDEQTPHIQALMIPVTKDIKGNARLSAAHFFNNDIIKNEAGNFVTVKNKMEQLQDAYFNAVSKKHGLKRGDKISTMKKNDAEYIPPKHQHIQQWRKEQFVANFFSRIKTPRALVDAKKEISGLKREMRKAIKAAKNEGKQELSSEISNQLIELKEKESEVKKSMKVMSSENNRLLKSLNAQKEITKQVQNLSSNKDDRVLDLKDENINLKNEVYSQRDVITQLREQLRDYNS